MLSFLERATTALNTLAVIYTHTPLKKIKQPKNDASVRRIYEHEKSQPKINVTGYRSLKSTSLAHIFQLPTTTRPPDRPPSARPYPALQRLFLDLPSSALGMLPRALSISAAPAAPPPPAAAFLAFLPFFPFSDVAAAAACAARFAAPFRGLAGMLAASRFETAASDHRSSFAPSESPATPLIVYISCCHYGESRRGVDFESWRRQRSA